MTNDPQRNPTGARAADDLQFDRAEAAAPVAPGPGEHAPVDYGTPSSASGVAGCAACGEPIIDVYFEANGKVVCPPCRDAVVASRHGGSGVSRFVQATVMGVLGGLAGAAVWWAVRYFFSLQVGIIAILVGFLVGTGVRKGSQGRGGVGYQILAVLITYLCIAANYLPDLLRMGFDQGEPAVFVWIASIIRALAQPFLRGIAGILGMVIIGFALYQAWIMNKASALAFSGPYRLAPAGGASAGVSPAGFQNVPPPPPPISTGRS